MASLKHTLILRKGLQLPEGLLASQTFHVGSEFLLKRIKEQKQFTAEELEWMNMPYVAVLSVQTLEELEDVYKDAVHKLDGQCDIKRWDDVLYHPVLKKALKTFVGFSIGPCDADVVRTVTGKLPLY
jgi:peptidyl-tRNA hydrolase